jgi:serine/threonine-protein kinase
MLPEWRPKLVDHYQSLGYKTLEAFCAANPKLSTRTIDDAWKSGWMTEKSFDSFAELLGYDTRRQLLDAWGRAGEPGGKPTRSPETAPLLPRRTLVSKAPIHFEHNAPLIHPDRNPGDAAAPSASRRSIAVLPFVNMSQREDQEYLSDGLSEDIIHLLANLPELSVTARTSAFAFRGKTLDIRTIAERLNVAMILEGSVRRDGNRLRITAQLVSAADGYMVWSERYDRTLASVFAVQEEIASAIATALKLKLSASSPGHARYTPSLPAYEACKKGWYQFFKATHKSLARSREYFEEAVTLDPQYALAHAALSGYFLLAAMTGVSPGLETLPKARQAAEAALALDPALPEARATVAAVAVAYDHDWTDAQEQFRLANAAGKVPALVRYYRAGFYLMPTGRVNEAIEELAEALRDDPLNIMYRTNLGFFLYRCGEPERGAEEIRRALEVDENYWPAHVAMSLSHFSCGMLAEALVAARRASQLAPWSQSTIAVLAGITKLNGKWEQGEKLIQQLQEEQPRLAPVAMGLYHLLGGEFDAACDWFEKAIEQRDPSFIRYH